ncbi:MAG: DUF1573 domain-containing protein [Candidatus Bipolaricaulia bacterium]
MIAIAVRRVILPALGILVVGLLGWYGYFSLDQNPSPQIQVTPSTYDFGLIPYSPVQKVFTVKNVGKRSLEIWSVSTSCGCTRAEVETERLEPEEETALRVRFDPNLMSERPTGEILRVVYIKSNDPKQPEVEVALTATLPDEGG